MTTLECPPEHPVRRRRINDANNTRYDKLKCTESEQPLRHNPFPLVEEEGQHSLMAARGHIWVFGHYVHQALVHTLALRNHKANLP